MLRRILISLAAAVCLCSCADRPKLIPADTLSDIYAQMYVSDQWLMKNHRARVTADTTLFYDGILQDFGYDFKDYDYSVRKYLENPEKMKKIFERTRECLEKRRKELSDMKAIVEKNRKIDLSLKDVYEPSEFWPMKYDTTDFSINAKRRNGIRSDKKSASGDFFRFEPAS